MRREVMIKLTFYGGVNEIGGNKILLQDKKTRGLLDFGQSFARASTGKRVIQLDAGWHTFVKM